MGIKIVDEYIAFKKLESPGIYIFINKINNKFYVGKSSTKMYDRVKCHLISSHNDTINILVNDKDTELYIYTINDFNNNDLLYDEDILFIEYYTQRYLVEEGYESINGKNSFTNEIKEKYNGYEKVDLGRLIKLEDNLFASNLKDFLLYKSKLKNLNTIQKRLNYQYEKSKKLENDMINLKSILDNNKKDYIQKVHKDYYAMKNKTYDLSKENDFLKNKLCITEKALRNLKETKDIQVKSIEKELYEKIDEKNKHIKDLEYKILSLQDNYNSNSTTNHNIIIKKSIKDIISKLSEVIEIILEYISEGTHYRGTEKEYNIYLENKYKLKKIKKFLDDICSGNYLLYELNCFNDEKVIYTAIAYCCNIYKCTNIIDTLLEDNRVVEKDNDNKEMIITCINNKFLEEYNDLIHLIEKNRENLEEILSNL